MNIFKQRCRLVVLCVAIISGSSVLATVPDERDRQVLESLLLNLLNDPNFDVTRVPATDGTSILLHIRNPEKTGFLMPQQIKSDIGNRILPDEVESDLRRRNTPIDATAGPYDSIEASFTNITFAAGIVVTDLEKIRKNEASFREKYPAARGWLAAYLPGYSSDGKSAVVRASVGPWAHAAMVTAVLEKDGDKWVVKWWQITRFV